MTEIVKKAVKPKKQGTWTVNKNVQRLIDFINYASATDFARDIGLNVDDPKRGKGKGSGKTRIGNVLNHRNECALDIFVMILRKYEQLRPYAYEFYSNAKFDFEKTGIKNHTIPIKSYIDNDNEFSTVNETHTEYRLLSASNDTSHNQKLRWENQFLLEKYEQSQQQIGVLIEKLKTYPT